MPFGAQPFALDRAGYYRRPGLSSALFAGAQAARNRFRQLATAPSGLARPITPQGQLQPPRLGAAPGGIPAGALPGITGPSFAPRPALVPPPPQGRAPIFAPPPSPTAPAPATNPFSEYYAGPDPRFYNPYSLSDFLQWLGSGGGGAQGGFGGLGGTAAGQEAGGRTAGEFGGRDVGFA